MAPQDKRKYEQWMRRCIKLAKIAKRRGDSPVGCIIVQNGKIVSEGIEGGKTHNDITYHAEIVAIRNAVDVLSETDLSDCILVTSHEPCIMCSYVIRHHKIKTVIAGMNTGEIGGYSSSCPVLIDDSIERWASPPQIVDGGVLEEECRRLND